MTYSLIASVLVQSTNNNNATSSAIDTTGANLIAVSMSSFGGSSRPVQSDSKGNTPYSPLTDHSNGVERSTIFYYENPTVGSGHTFTVSGTNSFPGIAVTAWSGGTTSSFDQESGATTGAGSTTLATGSVTPSEDNELVIAGLAWNSLLGGATINGGFTVSNQNPAISGGIGVGQAYLVQTTATAANPTWTFSSSDAAASIATFKAAAAGGFFARYYYDMIAQQKIGS